MLVSDRYFLKVSLIIAALLLLGGCASTPDEETNDPWEGYNRWMYNVNDGFDSVITKPIAKGYNYILPAPINQGLSNVFGNVDDFVTMLNDLFQLKFKQAGSDAYRVVVNSTVGVAGIFDIAGYAGVQKHKEDFGQTLGHWGVGTGPYVVLPFFGPSSVRDGFGLIPDIYLNPITYVNDVPTRNRWIGLYIVDKRAGLLKAEKVLKEAAIDEYAYVRDSYQQYRRNLVYDGNPPDDEEFDLFED